MDRELARYKLNLEGVWKVRWDKQGTVRAGTYILPMEKEAKIINWEQDLFVHHSIKSAVERVECVNDRMSRIVPRGR